MSEEIEYTPHHPPLNGETQLVGLMGWPVSQSLWPVMYNAAFAALGLNWRYVPLPVAPGEVEAAARGLAALNFRGANVIAPHTETVLPVLSTLLPNARALGAVNTLVIDRRADGVPLIIGHNTTDRAFIQALRAGGFPDPRSRHAVVVGAGGAARAVAFGLLWTGIGKVSVLNRTPARAQALVAHLGRRCPEDARRLEALPLTAETLIETARVADLLINATCVGMSPHLEASIWPADPPIPAHLTVFDLVCSPHETQLLRQAQVAAARPIRGLEMLIYQGAAAFTLWTKTGSMDDIASIMRATLHAPGDRNDEYSAAEVPLN